MKLLPILLCLLLVGCSDSWNDAHSSTKCREALMSKYHTSDVVRAGDASYRFIVRTSNGDIYYVECEAITSTAPTLEDLVFHAQ